MGCGESPDVKARSNDQAERLAGLQQLAAQGSSKAPQVMAAAVRHPDLVTARTAVRLAAGIPGDQGTAILRDAATQDARPEVRRDAVIELGHRKDPALGGLLRERLRNDADSGVRAAAATALGRLDDRTHLAALVWAALSDADPAVRAAAVRGVERTMRLRFGYDPAGPAEAQRLALDRLRRWAERAGWATPPQPPFAAP
jgi:HEAT repeat protein